jgi:glycosyltransferase involved in cell wall biosynthesis
MRKKIIVHYHWCPHFRNGIFEALSLLSRNEVKFIFGDKTNVDGLKLLHENFNYPTVIVKNTFFYSFIFQVFNFFNKEYLTADRVLLGDIKFINAHISIILSKLGFGRTFLWTHGILEQESGIKWFIRKFFYGLADGVFTYSQRSADLLSEGGVKKKIVAIGNSNFSEVEERINNSPTDFESKKNIVYIGRVNKGKNLEKVINVIAQSPNEFVFKIIGDGDAIDDLKELVIRKKLENNVVFYGSIYSENELLETVEDCSFGIIATEVGLAGFTYLKLKLGLVYEDCFVHKPELHILNELGYGYGIEEINMQTLIQARQHYSKVDLTPVLDSLYNEFSSESVAQKLLDGLS